MPAAGSPAALKMCGKVQSPGGTGLLWLFNTLLKASSSFCYLFVTALGKQKEERDLEELRVINGKNIIGEQSN